MRQQPRLPPHTPRLEMAVNGMLGIDTQQGDTAKHSANHCACTHALCCPTRPTHCITPVRNTHMTRTPHINTQGAAEEARRLFDQVAATSDNQAL